MNAESDITQPDRRRFGWEQFRFVVAALLLTAAIYKIFRMQEILTGSGLLRTMPRLVAVASFEAAAATWLTVGNRFWSWLLTLTTFGVFIASALYAIATNQSCNCFGEQLTPETMVVIDAVVLLLTLFLRPGTCTASSRSLTRQLAASLVVGGLVATVALGRYDVLMKIERTRLLVADVLVGKTWPLDGTVDPRLAELSSGKWMVLILNEDCSPCRNLVGRFFADPATHRPEERTAIFVFSRDTDHWRFQFDRVELTPPDDALLSWPHGKPSVISPAVFLLDNNIVVDGAEGNETEGFLGSRLSRTETPSP
ncbi:MAG: MauE/DoxX family redox-associated membrane protein [Planctomyces sp.]|jgi:hypothetical protein